MNTARGREAIPWARHTTQAGAESRLVHRGQTRDYLQLAHNAQRAAHSANEMMRWSRTLHEPWLGRLPRHEPSTPSFVTPQKPGRETLPGQVDTGIPSALRGTVATEPMLSSPLLTLPAARASRSGLQSCGGGTRIAGVIRPVLAIARSESGARTHPKVSLAHVVTSSGERRGSGPPETGSAGGAGTLYISAEPKRRNAIADCALCEVHGSMPSKEMYLQTCGGPEQGMGLVGRKRRRDAMRRRAVQVVGLSVRTQQHSTLERHVEVECDAE